MTFFKTKLYISLVFISSILFLLNGCNSTSNNTPEEVNETETKHNFTLLESNKTGIDFNNTLTESPEINVISYQYFHNGGGVAAGDVNNDGLPDLYFTGNMSPNALYLNMGNMQFKDIAREAGVGGKQGWTTGCCMIDINNDGNLDIYVCRSGNVSPKMRENLLFINNGNGTFSEKGKEYGLNHNGYSSQAAFLDYDLDGDLDAYIMNHPINPISNENNEKNNPYTNDAFLRNDKGKFVNISDEVGLEKSAASYGLGVAVSDLNNDGYPDMYVSNDYVEHDFLYINKGDGTFTQQLQNAMPHISNFSMGNDVADINNDGFTDLFIADMASKDNYRTKANMSGMSNDRFWSTVERGYHYQYMINTLQLNNGNGTFSDVSQLAGVDKSDWSWAPLWGDYDNDGKLDLFVSNGLRKEARNNDFVKQKKELLKKISTQNDAQQQMQTLKRILDIMPQQKINNAFFANQSNLEFNDVSDTWVSNTKPSWSNGATFADLDNDGDLDIVTNNIDENAFVYENTTEGNNYLKVKLKGSPNNLSGLGTKLLLQVEEETLLREHYLTRGYLSSVEDVIHFGLGIKKPSKLTVIWPDGKSEEIANIEVNKLLKIDYANAKGTYNYGTKKAELITEYSNSGLNFTHKENVFDDFIRESLIPHKMSALGPSTAIGDINNDGLEDVFIGGASGQKGAIYVQNKENRFTRLTGDDFDKDINYEDAGAAFIDVNGDGFKDLYIASGGNEKEENDAYYTNRLYINNEGKSFERNNRVHPEINTSNGCVVVNDFNGDGVEDLFIAGRQTPGKYPFAASSTLLFGNNGSLLEDVTSTWLPELAGLGMVSSAVCEDFTGNGKIDLLLTGEWMQPMLFENTGSSFKKINNTIFEQNTGWWFSLAASDIDNDGDMDIVAGNLGLNYKFKATAEKPFAVYAADFDSSGSIDIVLSYYSDNQCFPLRGRECSSNQMPFIKEKFPTYDAFAKASLQDVYGEKLKQALNYNATNFRTVLFINDGKGNFKLKELPREVQRSPINGIVCEDINKDGNIDLILAGNMYGSEVETIRADAGIGNVLFGDGKGNFSVQSHSGFFANRDVKSMNKITLANGKTAIIVGNNNAKAQFFIVK